MHLDIPRATIGFLMLAACSAGIGSGEGSYPSVLAAALRTDLPYALLI